MKAVVKSKLRFLWWALRQDAESLAKLDRLRKTWDCVENLPVYEDNTHLCPVCGVYYEGFPTGCSMESSKLSCSECGTELITVTHLC